MTLTMSRLPDSFLPSGAFQHPDDHPLSLAGLVTSHPSSVISPLALPRNANQVSYFEDHRLSRHSSVRAQPQHYLSPQRDQRSASLSPTRHSQNNNRRTSALVSPTLSPLNESPEQVDLHLRRVLIQNRRLLENWEAERAHLEANRARAEEIYKEERAIMDEDRLVWAEKEAIYLNRIGELERENAALRDSISRTTVRNPSDSFAVGAGRGSSDVSETSPVNLRATSDAVSPGAIPIPGLGHTMPESHPFEPLDPRMQSSSPQASTPGEGPESQDSIPSIDVQEVHPELEGIRLRPTAIKKSTFMDGKPPSPPHSVSTATGTNSHQGSPTSRTKSSPELTKEALQAPVESRLTMHAGHTPNHSLSTFPTAISTNATNTAGSSGTSTPTHGQHSAIDNARGATQPPNAEQLDQDAHVEHPEPRFEPSDDVPELSGPLSLRNQPAYDEVFLGRVADRLMNSLQADDATPTVLKSGFIEPEAAPHPASEAPKNDADSKDESDKPDEAGDIPLKLRSTSNFGAPLGSISGF